MGYSVHELLSQKLRQSSVTRTEVETWPAWGHLARAAADLPKPHVGCDGVWVGERGPADRWLSWSPRMALMPQEPPIATDSVLYEKIK